MEKEAYRDNLERICEAFPGKELLTQKDVAGFVGMTEKTVPKHFPFKSNRISKATLARCLS